MPGLHARIQAYEYGGNIFNEPYRGLNGGLSVAGVLFFSSKHSWELWGSNFNYYALTDKSNKLGRILIDSVLMHHKEQVAESIGSRDQPEHYGVLRWERESTAEIGKATVKAMFLFAYVVAPMHRNASKEGSGDINNWLLKEQNIG